VSSEHYTKTFYQEMRNGARLSAEVMVPIVLQMIPASSVVDVGCGDGTWLAAFHKFGIKDFLGIDGDYVQAEDLQIAPKYFQPLDLSKPFRLERRFDLAISLEVAEHLPRDSASSFIESLIRLAPAVLFSAAIPLQGGNNHVNEQWPDVWAALFREYDYLPIDFIRRRVWKNKSVDWWYVQNTILFAEAKYVAGNATLKSELEQTNLEQLSLVHPRTYLEVLRSAAPIDRGVRYALKQFLVSLKNAVNRKTSIGSPARTNPEYQSDRVQSLGKD
jgi:SAM-dependent methyltransferase